ncbi:MAG: RIP metalloprotease RseP [Bdellovibrionota bacterium]
MSIVIAIAALGILIFVHELGHFLVAKWSGVKVERFSLGFGPKLIAKQWGETEYVLAAVPFGGYVKMHGDVPEEWEGKAGLSPEDLGAKKKDEEPREPIDPARSFLHKPIPQRIAIALAGPAFNLIFGYFAILAFLWVQPQPVALVGTVQENSPAARAGIQMGDRILSVDGKETPFLGDFLEAIQEHKGPMARIRFERGSETKEADVDVRSEEGRDEFGESLLIGSIGVGPPLSTFVAKVEKDGPAAKAGLESGDRITKVDGESVRFWDEVSRRVRASEGRAVRLTVDREGKSLDFEVTPEVRELDLGEGRVEKRAVIAILGTEDFVETKPAGAAYALANASGETWRLMVLIPKGLLKLIVGDVPRDQIGGPIEIGAQLKRASEQGLGRFLFLLALISINLGILNLLPIPVLDGGHILFFLVEALNRKPVSLKAREIAQQVGLSLLLLLMLFAFYNDIRKIVWPWITGLFGPS